MWRVVEGFKGLEQLFNEIKKTSQFAVVGGLNQINATHHVRRKIRIYKSEKIRRLRKLFYEFTLCRSSFCNKVLDVKLEFKKGWMHNAIRFKRFRLALFRNHR